MTATLYHRLFLAGVELYLGDDGNIWRRGDWSQVPDDLRAEAETRREDLRRYVECMHAIRQAIERSSVGPSIRLEADWSRVDACVHAIDTAAAALDVDGTKSACDAWAAAVNTLAKETGR